MEQEIQQIIHGQPDEAPSATAAVLAAVKAGYLSVLGLVALLREPLTDDEDHEARARAVQLLSKVAEEAPAALLKGDVAVMAEFLGGKLQDWRCVAAAVPGCLALLQRHRRPELAELPQAAALQLVRLFCCVHAQGLDYRGRLMVCKTLLEILEGPYGVPAALAGVDLVSHTWASMEREVDPRCLMVALQCVRAVGQLYSQRRELSSVSHLSDNLEDIFDVGVVAYFPLMFTPPRDDPHSITREALLQCTIEAMASCPQFAPLAIPLMSEKLGSSLKQAKADALQALPICLRSWGPAATRPHMQAIWLMLKAELMAPAAAAEASLGSEQLSAKCSIAAAAAAALTQAVAALGPGLLDRQVLNDVAVEDLQQYLGLMQSPPWGSEGAAGGAGAAAAGAAGAGWDLDSRAQARLVCIAGIVAAVAAAGGASCDAVCDEILEPAVAAVLADTAAATAGGAASTAQQQQQSLRPLQADCAVLCVLHNVMRAVAGAATSAASDAFAVVAQLAPDVAQLLQQLQQRLVLLETAAEAAAGGRDSPQLQQVQHPADMFQAGQMQLWLLLLWQDLLRLQSIGVVSLQQDHLDAAARQLVQQAMHGSTISIQLQLGLQADSVTESAQAAAAHGLELLARAAAAGEAPAAARSLQDCVEHALTLPLMRLDSVSSTVEQQLPQLPARALELMQQLAGSSAAAGWQVLCWLQPLVMHATRQGHMASLCRLLPILHSHCLPTLPADLPPEQSAAAASFCIALLQGWKQHGNSSNSSDLEEDAVLHSCVLLPQLACRCSRQDQQQLLLTGCEWVTASAAESASPAPGCLGAAVLAAARPGLLNAASVQDLLHTLAVQSINSSSRWLDRLAAGVALAGVINKACGTNSQQTEAATPVAVTPDALLQSVMPILLAPAQQLQQTLQQAAAAPGPNDPSEQQWQQEAAAAAGALQALAWLSRGLAMQRHDAWQQCMQQVLLLLAQLPAGPIPAAAEAQGSAGVNTAGSGMLLSQHSVTIMWSAVDYFSVLVAAAEGTSSSNSTGSSTAAAAAAPWKDLEASPTRLGFMLSCHSMTRPLWQQKAFTLALQAVQTSQAAAAAAATAAGTTGPVAGQQVAAACLLAAAPTSIVAGASEEVVPLLLQCLVQLSGLSKQQQQQQQQAGHELGPGVLRLLQLLHSCLLLLADALMAGGGGEAAKLLELHVEQLLAVLCDLACLLPAKPAAVTGGQQQWHQVVLQAAAVREVALMCLTSSIAALPYHLLHPHRRRVLLVVAAALDDDRRAVRRAAVVCRAAWTVG